MSSARQASSQAAWTLIMEGATAARLETHRLSHLIRRALALVQTSEQKEHLHQVAGDIIQALPKRMLALETNLDRTLLALSDMGQDFLRARLPLEDKTLVDEALEGVPSVKPPTVKESAKRVALAYMKRSQ